MKSEIEWKEAKEKFFSPQNWVAEKINGRTIKSTLLAQGSDGWKENKNKVAPESSCILEFEDGSEIEFRGRNLNQWMGINFSSPISINYSILISISFWRNRMGWSMQDDARPFLCQGIPAILEPADGGLFFILLK